LIVLDFFDEVLGLSNIYKAFVAEMKSSGGGGGGKTTNEASSVVLPSVLIEGQD